jgi:glycosyltransferase involved in cell wall biosynthesis
MQFSIIIPTRDRAVLLRKTLFGLQCQQYNSNEYEVIVVNNNPHDLHTSSILADLMTTFPQLRCLTEPRRGASHARNLGCKHAKFKHLIFIDDDILVKPEFLQGYTAAWKKRPHARILGGPIYSQLEDGTFLNATQQRLLKELPWCFAHHNNFKDATPISDTLTAFSANMSYRQKKMGTSI